MILVDAILKKQKITCQMTKLCMGNLSFKINGFQIYFSNYLAPFMNLINGQRLY